MSVLLLLVPLLVATKIIIHSQCSLALFSKHECTREVNENNNIDPIGACSVLQRRDVASVISESEFVNNVQQLLRATSIVCSQMNVCFA